MKISRLSVVAPAYNEAQTVEEFCRRTSEVLRQNAQSHEIIIVDDGSTDETLERLNSIQRNNPSVKTISFSRNFGHAAAISAGLDHAEGEAVLVIDADLQDPPEVLPEFLAKWRAGHQVVYGIRTKRKEGMIKRASYWLFYRLFRKLVSLKDVPLDSGDFALLDRQVVLHIRSLPERSRFMRGLRTWTGFRQTGLSYERASRYAGETKYSYAKLFRLAFDGIFSFSYVPLRLATILGFIVAGIALVASAGILYERLVKGVIGTNGFASLIISILFIGAVQLICIGILGEYIGRISEEVKQRPLYIIREKTGFDK